MQDDGNLNPNREPIQKEPTKKEKAAEAGKDVAEVAAKGAATYFGGPVGNQIANAALNTKTGQKITQGVGNLVARNPITRKVLSKAQPAISQAKPLANGAIDALGANPTNAASAAGSAASAGAGAAGAASNASANASQALNNGDIGSGSLPKLASNTPSNTTGTKNIGSSSSNRSSSSSFLGSSNDQTSSSEESDGVVQKESVTRTLWKKIPLHVKLYIFMGLGILVLIIVITAFFMGLGNIFLDYSDDVADSQEYKEEYEEYFTALCEEGDEDCTEEEIKKSEELLKSQEAFYNRLDKLSDKYLSSDETTRKRQRYMILTTVFYGYTPGDMLEGMAFTLDEEGDDDIDENTDQGTDIYKEETDTLKELTKQFDVYGAYCNYQKDGETEETSEEMRDAEGNAFILGYWEAVRVQWSIFNNPVEGFEEARESCEKKSGHITTLKSSGQSAEENFYRYLEETTFLDKRSSLKSSYAAYGKAHGLDTENFDSNYWPEEDLKVVRKQVVEDIKNIVEAQMPKEEESMLALGDDTAYWWPIGSVETTTTKVGTSSSSPMSTEITQYYADGHEAIDIGTASESGVVPIIASDAGTVTLVSESISMPESNSDSAYPNDNSSYGNFVKIKHEDGTSTIYAHLYKNTITVKEGDTVVQGQIIGYMGSSGNSTNTHLHFEIRDANDTNLDPLNKANADGNYVDPDTPKSTNHKWWPIGSSDKNDQNVNSGTNKIYADGDPQYTAYTQHFGSTEMGSPHMGSDIQADTSTNVIASRSGTVIGVVTECTSGYIGNKCGDTWGNYVFIEDKDGRQERYAHLSYGTITVKVGDQVDQGQVIAKAGATGNVTGPHLHFEIYENGTRINPEDFIDPDNPRKQSLMTGDLETLIKWIDTFEGGTTSEDGKYYPVSNKLDGVYTAGHGVTLENNAEEFKKYNIDVWDYMYNGALLPVDIVDAVRLDVINGRLSYVRKAASDAGLALNDYQVYALVSATFNLGTGYMADFIVAYRKYGDTQEFYDNHFSHYVHSKGEVLPGLVTRRKKEFELMHNHNWLFGY